MNFLASIWVMGALAVAGNEGAVKNSPVDEGFTDRMGQRCMRKMAMILERIENGIPMAPGIVRLWFGRGQSQLKMTLDASRFEKSGAKTGELICVLDDEQI